MKKIEKNEVFLVKSVFIAHFFPAKSVFLSEFYVFSSKLEDK